MRGGYGLEFLIKKISMKNEKKNKDMCNSNFKNNSNYIKFKIQKKFKKQITKNK